VSNDINRSNVILKHRLTCQKDDYMYSFLKFATKLYQNFGQERNLILRPNLKIKNIFNPFIK